MSESSDSHIRGFQWRLLSEFSQLLNSFGRHGFRSWPESPDEVRTELESLRLDPEDDIALLSSGGALCGYALTLAEPDIDRVVASLATTAECSAYVRKLLDFIDDRVKSAGVSSIHVAVRGVSVEPVDQLVDSGFNEISGILELTLPRENASKISDTSLAKGFSVRPMRSAAEALLLTQVQNRVFEQHWGFSKNTPEEVMARLGLSGTGPDYVLFIESAEGDIVGYIWTALEWQEDHTSGKILMTGVLPEFRGLGLGRALVNAGVKHLLSESATEVQLEVMEDNLAAIKIYEGIGFERSGGTSWYEKRV